MKIIHLTTNLNIGGITRYIETLSRAQLQLNHEVWVISAGGTETKAFEKIGVHLITLPLKTKSVLSPKLWWNYFKLKKIIVKNKIDLIHAHKRTSQVLAKTAQSTTGCRFITSCHFTHKVKLGRRLFPCWGDHVIAISQNVKQYLEKNYKTLKPTQIHLIPTGMWIEDCKNTSKEEQVELRKQLKLFQKTVIGCVARLKPEKGQAALIKAFAKIHQQYPDTLLLLLGDGETKPALEKLIKELNIQDATLILAGRSNPHPIYSIIDLYVQPSNIEPLGITVMEAQAHGLPIVVPPIDGFLDLVKNNKTGIILEDSSENTFIRAINQLLENSEKMSLLGEQAKQHAVRHYSAIEMAKKIDLIQED